MKLNEFKAWFEGFTESLEGTPSKKQWERIKEQVKEIDGVSVSYPVYIDRYVRPYWGNGYYWNNPYAGAVGLAAGNTSNNLSDYKSAIKDFDGVTAMYAAGKAEALAH